MAPGMRHLIVCLLLAAPARAAANDLLLLQWTVEEHAKGTMLLALDRARLVSAQVRRTGDFETRVEFVLDAPEDAKFEFRCKDVDAARTLLTALRAAEPEPVTELDLTGACVFADD
jgi:hypothetical protein